eukprot:gnl/Dysnectes_brevis/823_a908_1524.p1 GENE.gnl/Dysnectes_brevis/823_a908_1524~~gnl/Dysnectes_brevis/823_a908_1524.p1  ORF type:complete len:864 (+),score=338.02 gnl/Dysnectes_brevis/823_a908_1524:144-2735(+)
MTSSSKSGELREWSDELGSSSLSVKRDAVKKVIAAMTVGKNVSGVFSDVVKCIVTPDLELKKLVYLYLINYAKSNPETTILAVNTFVKDSENKESSLIRALAIRTMGCIRVPQITEYICEPLARALRDRDPYVRKTATLTVAKLYQINSELCMASGFVDTLRNMLLDENQTVVANAVASLVDISQRSGKSKLAKLNAAEARGLLAAMAEANEWSQVYILDSLVNYVPVDGEEGNIVQTAERLCSRLQHANSAVVISAIRALLHILEYFPDQPSRLPFLRKMCPPLVTLLSGSPGVQYACLRMVPLLLARYPALLSRDLRVFHCKYHDTLPVKMEKLDILLTLADDDNAEDILAELKVYAGEVEVIFVRKAVRCIGTLAIKVPGAADVCIQALAALVDDAPQHLVQEAIVVMRDIFRRYPGRFESVLGSLCAQLERLDEPGARAAFVWVLGEYAANIEDVIELLEGFGESFSEEDESVQLQILTSAVKTFLACPDTETEALLHSVLRSATEGAHSPDVRDRGYLYWRLLSAGGEDGFGLANAVVRGARPPISSDLQGIPEGLRDRLLSRLGFYSSLDRRAPEIIFAASSVVEHGEDEESSEEVMLEEQADSPEAPAGAGAADTLDELLDLGDLMGDSPAMPAVASTPSLRFPAVPPVAVLPAARGHGLAVQAGWTRRGGAPVLQLHMHLQPSAAQPMTGLLIQFNKNMFGLSPISPRMPTQSIAPGQKVSAEVPCAPGRLPAPAPGSLARPNQLQVALKTSAGVLFFACAVPPHVLFQERPAPVQGGEVCHTGDFQGVPAPTPAKLSAANVGGAAGAMYARLRLVGGEAAIAMSVSGGKLSVRGPRSSEEMLPVILQSMRYILK